jgi:hypothetical protein
MPDTLFQVASSIAALGWLFLVFLPRWRWSATLIAPVIIPTCLGAIYAWLVISRFGSSEGGFGSLDDVATLFRDRYVLLAGWIHYLAFDLFIGSWEVRDAQRLGIPHLAVIPALFLTFMFGPIGLLLYFVLRVAWKKVLPIDASTASIPG